VFGGRPPGARLPGCAARRAAGERTLLCTLPGGVHVFHGRPPGAPLRCCARGGPAASSSATGWLVRPNAHAGRLLNGAHRPQPGPARAALPAAAPRRAARARRYYRALSLMETRFPVGDDAEHVRLRFTWYDSFRPSKKTEQASIHYEKASVLFNVGAVLTQMALAADRGSDAGLKEAARRFQARRGARPGPCPRPRCRQGVLGDTAPACCLCSRAVCSEGPRRQRARRRQEAAGMFGELRDNASLRVEAPRPVDIGPECAGMLERLCLAQAQEVTYEKARADKKNPALLARRAPARAAPPPLRNPTGSPQACAAAAVGVGVVLIRPSATAAAAGRRRLAKQAAAFYDEVGRMLAVFPLSQHFDRSWGAHVAVKAALYDAETQMAAGAALHEAEDVHIEIARLRVRAPAPAGCGARPLPRCALPAGRQGV